MRFSTLHHADELVKDAGVNSVITEVDGGIGYLTLDRPRALNALDTPMIRAMRTALHDWREDDDVHTVLVRSTSPKAFCAGGDIRAVRQLVLDGRHGDAVEFFREEYELNREIAEYPKPYVALVDGICMGGGLGVSVHGSVRILTERAVLAMPETAIGFVPDVGATHFLPQLDGALGRYLGLTGARLPGLEAVAAGLGTHFVASADVPAFLEAVGDAGLDDVLTKFADPSPDSALPELSERVEATFGTAALADLPALLRQDDSDWATTALGQLTAASPLSLRLTDQLIRLGTDDDLRGCLRRELDVAASLIREPDFAEGVRATLVDKTRDARWSVAEPGAVPDTLVDRILAAH